MKTPTPHPLSPRRGFTLVEMLASIVVLSLMLVGLGTATNFVSQAWLNSVGSIDNFTKARVTLSLMSRDIQTMVMRPDLGAFVDTTGANAACAFYSNVQSYTSDSSTRAISLLQYQLTQDASSSSLQRVSTGINYKTVSPTVGTTGSLPQPTGSTARTETLSTGVIAFKWQFVDGTGTVLTPPFTLTSPAPTSSALPFYYDYNSPGAAYNPRAVVISMVVMTDSAYRLATRSNLLSTVVACFPTAAPANGQTYTQVWNGDLDQPSTAFLALPLPIRKGIQVFERHVPLPFTTPSL